MKKHANVARSGLSQSRQQGLVGECRILVAFPRSERTEARLTLSEYGGRKTIDLRLYYKDGCGEWSPSKKGTGVKPDELGDLIAALKAVAAEVAK